MYSLKRIIYTNFRLLQTADLSLRPGIFFVGGENTDVIGASSNMAGKSTLAVGIVWGLYGTDISGKRLADNVVTANSKRDTTASVCLIFSDNSGAEITITRIRYNGTPPPGQGKNMVELTQPGMAKQSGTADEMQVKIDALFGPVHLFLAAHVFAFSKETPFADSTDTEQKRLFDLLIGAGDLDAALAGAKQAAGDAKEKLINLSVDRETLNGKLEWLESHKQETAAQSTMDITALQQHLSTLTKKAGSLSGLRANAEKAHIRAKADLQAAESAYRAVESANTKAIRTLQDSVAIQKASLKEAEIRRNSLKAVRGDTPCPFCERPLSDTHLEALKRITEKAITDTGLTLLDLGSKIAELENAIADAAIPVKAAREVIEVHSGPALKHAEDTLASVTSELKIAAAELAAKETAAKQTLDTASGDITKFTAALNTLDAEIIAATNKMNLYQFWVEAFGARGIRAYRLDMITPVLNAYAECYSDYLFGDGTVLRYSTQTKTKTGVYRDQFEAALYRRTPKGYEKIETSLSAGQAMRRDIIHTFSMAELASELGKRTCSLLILDEVFVSIDQQGMTAIIRMLHECLSQSDTVLVIEHSDDLKASFDQFITVKRAGGVSTVLLDE